MTQIKGQKILTLTVKAGEIYEVKYSGVFTVNIINNTSGTLTVSEALKYYDDGTAANCLRLNEGMYFNRFKIQSGSMFISPEQDGDILITEVA